jgi:hypothetical protein
VVAPPAKCAPMQSSKIATAAPSPPPPTQAASLLARQCSCALFGLRSAPANDLRPALAAQASRGCMAALCDGHALHGRCLGSRRAGRSWRRLG